MGGSMKSVMLLLVVSLSANASELKCEAWFKSDGDDLVKKSMAHVGTHPVSKDEMYRAELNGFQYKVDLSKALSTLYATVVMGPKTHIFATVRVPDIEVHNDAFLDYTSESGLRASISCNLIR